MDELISLCKRRGFVFPSSEIYGGLANAYDYGPLGVELMRNIRNAWWNTFIRERDDMVGLDSQIIVHPQTWVASGHVASFSDPLVEDVVNHKRYRVDHLIEAWLSKQKNETYRDLVVENMTLEEMSVFLKENNLKSPDGNLLSEPRKFNLLFETHVGAVAGDKDLVYLRGETAQGIFINFKNVLDSNRVTLPFGIGQIGKSFRNEITTGQFVFRTFEFEQAEIEYFFDPEKTPWEQLMDNWKNDMWRFVSQVLGVREENLRWRRHTDKERSHYSKDTYDLDYKFPFGWKELWGVAYRTDYDLKQHMHYSGKSLEYVDTDGKKFVPHVIEPAVGVNRLFFMILADSFRKDSDRVWLQLKPQLAPYTAAVFPLVSNKPELVELARQVYREAKPHMSAYWDDRGNIGKRYKYQDEIGTPFCITVDYGTLEDKCVTIRNRDTMKQERVSASHVVEYINSELTV